MFSAFLYRTGFRNGFHHQEKYLEGNWRYILKALSLYKNFFCLQNGRKTKILHLK